MNSEKIRTVHDLTWDLNVLYVEDEPDIRNKTSDILSIFFKSIIIKENGQEGLEIFKNKNIDIVITDIRMPVMDGLEMISEIRKIDSNVPIVITTAFGDQEYFIRSIDLKVDKYLIKPIDEERALDVLESIGRLMDDRKKARELELRQIQEKMNQLSEKIVAEITDSYTYPCIIFNEGNIRYFNDAFCSLFEVDKMKKLLNHREFDIRFDMREGYLHDLSGYDQHDPNNNRVSISKRNGRKIYRVNRKTVQLDEENSTSHIYVFIDITLEEYQKIKIQSYTEMLEELVFNNRYRIPARKHSVSIEEKKDTTIAIKQEPPSEEMIDFSAKNDTKLTINEEENALLRRSHKFKTAACDYVKELDDEVLNQLQELDELDHDFSESIYQIQEEKNLEGFSDMAGQLLSYANNIGLLFEFEDLAYAIRSLSNLLYNLDHNQLDEMKMKKIILFLSGIQSDLAEWRKLLFIEQNSLDIHYLDSSLFSACLQIELIIMANDTTESESEDNDLVLF